MIIQPVETVTLETPAGPMPTQIFRPAAEGRYPGIVMFSEIFQITQPIARTAAFLAGHGFVVAVPEIFHELEEPGCVLAYDQAGADKGNQDKITKTVQSYDDDARAVIAFLQAHPACDGHIGALGICIGGHLAFRCSMNPQIQAGVCFYATDIHKGSLGAGMKDDSLARISEIKGEMLMIFGRQDPHVPREGRRIVYDAMSDAGVNFTWHEYNGQHAFLRDEGHRYDPELAHEGLGQAIALFRRTLRPAASATAKPAVEISNH
jgi:carboxymethylenebutenolidase